VNGPREVKRGQGKGGFWGERGEITGDRLANRASLASRPTLGADLAGIGEPTTEKKRCPSKGENGTIIGRTSFRFRAGGEESVAVRGGRLASSSSGAKGGERALDGGEEE